MCSIYELLSITNLYCNYCKFVHRYVGISRKEENQFSTRRRSLVMIDASIVSLKQSRSTVVPALADADAPSGSSILTSRVPSSTHKGTLVTDTRRF